MSVYTATSLGAGPAAGGLIATSANGSVIINANFSENLYVSTDSGVNWTTYFTGETKSWRSVTVSANGAKMAASVNGDGTSQAWVWNVSSWVQRDVPGDNNYYNAIQYTRDGTYLFLITGTATYQSDNDGVTWNNIGDGPNISNASFVTKMAVTDNGLKLACANGSYGVYIGTISGGVVTWETVSFGGSVRDNSIAMSGDGTKLAVCQYAGTSFKYNITGGSGAWSAPTGALEGNDIVISQDGSRFTAINVLSPANTGVIYTATDPAGTWTTSSAGAVYFGFIAGTSDLATIYLSDGDGAYIYKGLLGAGPEPVICFRDGSKILTFNPATGREEYTAVENIRPGTLVKTRMSGYVPVCMAGTSTVTIPNDAERTADRLYVCSKDQFPELTEDLYITGHHSILVNNMTDAEREECAEEMGRVYLTEGRCRLPAHIDRRTRVYEAPGSIERIWHFALEHNDEQMNYGVYANGLLVESCSIWRLRTMVGYELMMGNVYTMSNTVSAPPARLPIAC